MLPCSREIGQSRVDFHQDVVLKLDNDKNLEKFEDWKNISIILLKMDSPYLPSNPNEKFNSSKIIVQISREDWHQVKKYILFNFFI